MNRRLVSRLAVFTLLLLPILAGTVRAQSYPAKPIKFVVPFSAGSGTDQVARTIGQALASEFKATVVVDNRPGANGFIAAQAVATAPPDGYTVLITTNTTHAANQFLFKHLPYDPVKDFTPAALLRKGYQVLVVSPTSPLKSVGDVLALARRQPGKLTFGSGSSSSQVAGELFKQMATVDVTNVPYKSNPQALTDLLGGQIDMMFTDTSTGMPLVNSGKLRGLAVTSPRRLAAAPALETINEAGLKGYEMSYWTAAYLPKGAPPELVSRLNGMLLAAMRSPEMTKLLDATGTEIFTSTPEGLANFQAEESAKWARIIRTAGIQPE